MRLRKGRSQGQPARDLLCQCRSNDFAAGNEDCHVRMGRQSQGYLKNAGSLAIPAGYSTAAERGKILSTTMNDIPVTASADSLQLYKFSGKVYAKVGLSITNKGSKVLNEAGYTPYLQTASGTSFELTVNSAQAGYKIQPQEKKSIYYLAEIPAALNTNNMKLQFTQRMRP